MLALEIHLLLDKTLTESESWSLHARIVSAPVKKCHKYHRWEICLGFSEGFRTVRRAREDIRYPAATVGSVDRRTDGSENRQREGGMQNHAAHIINPVTIYMQLAKQRMLESSPRL